VDFFRSALVVGMTEMLATAPRDMDIGKRKLEKKFTL
jgi:hypothetical protein